MYGAACLAYVELVCGDRNVVLPVGDQSAGALVARVQGVSLATAGRGTQLHMRVDRTELISSPSLKRWSTSRTVLAMLSRTNLRIDLQSNLHSQCNVDVSVDPGTTMMVSLSRTKLSATLLLSLLATVSSIFDLSPKHKVSSPSQGNVARLENLDRRMKALKSECTQLADAPMPEGVPARQQRNDELSLMQRNLLILKADRDKLKSVVTKIRQQTEELLAQSPLRVQVCFHNVALVVLNEGMQDAPNGKSVNLVNANLSQLSLKLVNPTVGTLCVESISVIDSDTDTTMIQSSETLTVDFSPKGTEIRLGATHVRPVIQTMLRMLGFAQRAFQDVQPLMEVITKLVKVCSSLNRQIV